MEKDKEYLEILQKKLNKKLYQSFYRYTKTKNKTDAGKDRLFDNIIKTINELAIVNIKLKN